MREREELESFRLRNKARFDKVGQASAPPGGGWGVIAHQEGEGLDFADAKIVDARGH